MRPSAAGEKGIAFAILAGLLSCSNSPPPVASTAEIARNVCTDQQPWEDCFTMARDRSVPDQEAIRRDEKGPVQLTMEIAVLFCAEREVWRSCANKCAAVSDRDRAAVVCKKLETRHEKNVADCPDDVPTAKP